MTKTSRANKSRKVNVAKRVLILLSLSALLFVGWISGVVPFAYNTVRCGGLPVESTRFMASYSYRLPGDKGYGISPFSEYRFCTQEEIVATNGYRRDVSTDAGRAESEEQWRAYKEAQIFSLSKVNYTVYVPEGRQIEGLKVREIKGNTHTFYRVPRDEGLPIGVRQLHKDDAYNICHPNDNPNKRYCKTIGEDSQGREVKREYTYGVKGWVSHYVGTDIGDTGIILGAGDDDEEAIAMLGLMKEYVE